MQRQNTIAGPAPELNLEPDQNRGNQPDDDVFDIVGIWGSQVDTGQGTVSAQLILDRSGTFSQIITWNDLMTLDTGEHNMVGNAIYLTVTHHEPNKYKD